MDVLIHNGTVVTLNPQREVLTGTDVLVSGGRIAQIGKVSRKKHSGRRMLDATGKLVLPGFVHGHLHACQTLFRNRADGLELLDWLRERIWPLEAAHDAESMRASADLTFAELIRSGATAALDMGSVHHTAAVFESARDCGFRLTGGKGMMDHGQGLPAGLRETTDDSIAESLRLLETWHGAEGGRLRYAFAPLSAHSCSEKLLRQVAEHARARNVRVHTHASENATEVDLVRQQTGKDSVEFLHGLGLTGAHATFAHCVWLTAQEHRLLRETRTVVCHCPSSNLKLASGLAKIPELLQEGVAVALGADAAPCNNTLDMLMEMRLAALIHKPRVGPLAMEPWKVLELATLGGARALGLEDELGSLEPGKRADLIVVDVGEPHSVPSSKDVAAQLVYSARASDVRHVVIDGRIVMRDRELLTLDEREVSARAAAHGARMAARVL